MSTKFKHFLSYYKPYKKLFAALMATALLSSGAALLIPLCTRYLTADLLNFGAEEATRRILLLGAFMFCLVIIRVLLESFTDYRGHVMGAMMERDIRGQLFSHYQKLSFSFYDNRKVGELMSRLTNDLLSLTELYHHGPEDLMTSSVRFLGAFAIMFAINPTLALIVAAFIPPMAVFTVLVSRKMRLASKQSYEKIGAVNAQVEDSLSGIRVVKSFGGEAREEKKFSRINTIFFGSRKRIYKYESICYQGMMAFIYLITVAVVVFGGLGISGGGLSLPDLIAFLLYVNYVTEPITHLVHMVGQFQEGYASFERFHEMLSTQPEIRDCEKPKELKNCRGKVEFKNLCFSYGESLPPVLKDLNLTVEAGQQVALVGHSGVGKSTFCALIPRFYDATQGSVSIDGVDVRRLSQQSLHENVGVVEQDIYLFSGTVLENILYGKPGASREEVEEAAKRANAHSFITELPNGYDTDIGQRGVKLSGGQKQRLSIARAFLKNPPILILDEATSSLDSESEALVHQSLLALSRGRTTFIIAHRLSTIKNCQRILVIDEGKVTEEGSHQQLIEEGGIYASLYGAI